ncbi:hypothetical protein HanRHA438_Chr09g0382011 [Helianthus annuus]|nr:hypothetical protein HanIR_Chr09g0399721 [Helianthus annuus]KAJ0886661.1 hypothetical protein HanRHA438_Chr09g0382011 [Helianthus annuus]
MRGSSHSHPCHPIPVGIEGGPRKFDPGPCRIYTLNKARTLPNHSLNPDQVANISLYTP